MGSEEELVQLAKEELLRDVKLASMRAQYVGAHAWAKPQKLVANKRFLRNMLFHASRDQRSSQKHESSSDISEKLSHSENNPAESVHKSHKSHRSKHQHDLKRSHSSSENKSKHSEKKHSSNKKHKKHHTEKKTKR